jgi:conjugal transfer pilus assembly protein TraB
MAFADIFKRSRKPLDKPEGEGVSPVGGELAANEAVRRKQRMLLAGVAGVGLVVSSMWIFSGDDGKKVADTDGAEKVE